jgi:hypothetical protein
MNLEYYGWPSYDIAGDFNQEGIKNALVPLGENIAHLLIGETQSTLHDVVGLI